MMLGKLGANQGLQQAVNQVLWALSTLPEAPATSLELGPFGRQHWTGTVVPAAVVSRAQHDLALSRG
jgi:hypothetical protein